MPKPEPKKVRGVYEHPKGSGIWWVQTFTPKRHRERVGRKSDAIALYNKRRADYRAGLKMPDLTIRRRVTFGELIDDALAFARDHGRVMRNYDPQGKLLKKAFGSTLAEELKPAELTAWISRRGAGPATHNRYRAFISLCYREGIRNGKVTTNVARLIARRKEPSGRKRYLSRDEYQRILAHLQAHHPERVPAFVISVQTGMRLSEQFSLTWRDVDMERREINLRNTKNGDDRTIPMASTVYEQFASLRPAKVHPKKLVFPRPRNGKTRTIAKWFTDIIRSKAIGIHDYTWHNNRHTFCSWLAIAGTGLRTIQDLAGHRTLQMTTRYAHLSPDHKRAELERAVSFAGPESGGNASEAHVPPELPMVKKQKPRSNKPRGT